MSKQHKTIPNEPEEMPKEQKLPEIEQPKDPQTQEIPDESPNELPDELPADETKQVTSTSS
jgi:hypothetical protein